MPFKKGVSGNIKGRPPGRSKDELRAKVERLIDQNFEKIQTDLDGMDAKDRVSTLIKLIEFSLPRLKSIELPDNLGGLSDDQLDEIINEIKKIHDDDIYTPNKN